MKFYVVVVAFLLLIASRAGAQAGPCSAGNARLWCAHQDLATVPGGSQPNDNFGGALAWGDFDGDGHLDLAVGSPGEADGVANNAGAVHVFYGGGQQLLATGSQSFDQDSTTGDDDGGTETGDSFGAALAAGDFDGDGFDDLAIGSPGESETGTLDACGLDTICSNGGALHVYFGGPSGLTTTDAFFGTEQVFSSHYHDDSRIGAVLAAADLENDGVLDLLVGSPGDAAHPGRLFFLRWDGQTLDLTRNFGSDDDSAGFPSALAAGRVLTALLPRTVVGCADCDGGAAASGLVHVDNFTELIQTDFGTAGAGANDGFGASLAVGDFNGDGDADLAIGAPNKNHGSGNPDNSGRVYIAFGPLENGVQNEFDILGEDDVVGQTPAANENFGASLVAGDFDGDGFDDLVIGAPGEFSGSDGAFFPFFGSSAGLSGVTRLGEANLGGTPADGHRFGSVLAAGDLDGDGVDELAVGVPEAAVGGDNGAGIVYVTRVLDPALIFLDGFDEDATASWSAVVP